MKAKLLSFLLSIGIISIFAAGVFSQTKFKNPNVEYLFDLPTDSWKMTVKPSKYSPNVEYVYKFKKNGHLQIRKMKVKKDSLYSEIIKEEEQKLQFVPGYVAGKQENFNGNYKGRVFNYEYVKSGRPMSGRFYFMRATPTTVYILRFKGRKASLKTIRNETDSIVRTFSLKKAK